MQKVTDWLEKNVQWIAIGLGALFMLYMTWSYVLSPVAGVKIGQDDLGPGEIDTYTMTHVGKELELRMGENIKLPTTVPSYVVSFKDTMSWAKAPVIALDNMWPVLKPDIEIVQAPPPAPPGPGGVPAPVVAGNVKVTALPVPPPATPAEAKFGRSVVLLPAVAGQAPVAAPQPGQPVEGGVDKDWVTQMFKINMGLLDKEFQDKKMPPAPLNTTLFLQVEMERVEVDDNGQSILTTQAPVQPLLVYRDAPAPPFPADGATKDEQSAYLEWAKANQPDILQPLFYTTAKGDIWAKPGVQAMTQVQFDPATFKGDLSTLPPDQRQQVLDARREAQRLKDEQKKTNRPSRPAPGPGRGSDGAGPPGLGPNFAPRDNYAAAPGARPPTARPTGVPRPVGNPNFPGGMLGSDGIGETAFPGAGGYPGGGYTGGPTPVNLPQPGIDYPNQEFEPAKWKDKTIECWVHDDTVQPNKTYRYHLRYKMKNPIWAAGNVAEPPALADQFALESKWSEWSSPVIVPPLVNFFVLSPPFNGSTCKFEVFKWDKGELKSEAFTVGPGDQIGGTKDGIDFSTGWTVVDFRDDVRSDKQILLVNETGKLTTRSQKADQADPLYRGLKDQIATIKATETAAAPGGAVGGR